MVPWLPLMRGLFRDAALVLIGTLVLGTAANLVTARRLAWWGKGHEPPRSGVDFNLIDPGSADAMRASLPGVAFLDTRLPAEYAAGHVPGAQAIAYTDLQVQLTPEWVKKLRAADAVIVYGAGDETDIEQLLAQELHRRGWPPPYVLAGGFAGWQQGGLPVEGGAR
jgi:rhodanese-related sulfurtransferase